MAAAQPPLNRLPARHAQALVLAKRAVSAMGAAEKAIRQLDALLDEMGVEENSRARQEIAGLRRRLNSDSAPEKPATPESDSVGWWDGWWSAMIPLTRTEGERAAQQGLDASSNPYVGGDPDSQILADAWREGFQRVLRREQELEP